MQAQKYSVQNQLRRRFQRFMSQQGDFHHLLLTILRNLARDADRAAALAAGGLAAPAPEARVVRERFEERAAEYQVADVAAFYESALFVEHGGRLHEDGVHIVLAR